MNKILHFFAQIIRTGTGESSKRFAAMIILAMVVYIIIRYTCRDNYTVTLNALLIFITTILGVATFENIKK